MTPEIAPDQEPRNQEQQEPEQHAGSRVEAVPRQHHRLGHPGVEALGNLADHHPDRRPCQNALSRQVHRGGRSPKHQGENGCPIDSPAGGAHYRDDEH